MKMFMLTNRKDMKPMAFHMEKRVIVKYKTDYEKENPTEQLVLFKINETGLNNHPDFADLYLVRYGETYIQSKFLYIAQLDIEQLLYDLDYAHDVINRVIEISKNKKKVKKLVETLSIIDDEKLKLKRHVYSVDELKRRDEEYMVFRDKNYYE